MRPTSHPASRRHAILASTIALLLLFGACGSGGDGSGGSDADRLVEANREYLRRADWEEDQASCVSKKVDVDLEDLLSSSDGATDPTQKDEFEQFAEAVRECLRDDDDLVPSSTSVPPG